MTNREEDRQFILIVDDVPKNIQLIASILKNEGFTMAFAQNGEKALELSRMNPFDLILLDIMMPDMDGFEVCRQLRQDPVTKDVPVLFLTARTDTESVVKGFDVGAMDYVTKPVSEAELLARVRTHLSLHRTRKTLFDTNLRLEKEIQERKKTENRYKSMYENALQGMFRSEPDGKLLELNPAYAKILGFDTPEDVLAKGVHSDIFPDPDESRLLVNELKSSGRLFNRDVRIRKKDGETAWVLMNVIQTQDEEKGNILEGIVIDNTARKQAEDELRRSEENYRYMAVHDNLTGLYNTRYLYSALPELIEKTKLEMGQFSLIFLDIDNFKRVVDTYGHLHGSRTIQEVGATIQNDIRIPEYAVAYAGDEFVVVLPGYGKSRAAEKADAIRKSIAETEYLKSFDISVQISASFGVSTFPEDGQDMKEILSFADKAMFGVKAKGKNAVATGKNDFF